MSDKLKAADELANQAANVIRKLSAYQLETRDLGELVIARDAYIAAPAESQAAGEELRPLAISIGKLAGAHERLRATVPALEQQLRGADIEVAALRAKVTYLNEKLAAAQARIGDLEASRSAAITALELTQGRVSVLEKALMGAKLDLGVARVSLEVLASICAVVDDPLPTKEELDCGYEEADTAVERIHEAEKTITAILAAQPSRERKGDK